MHHHSCDVVMENVDLVTEILLRLPAKHALRCKSVCKKWLSLISDPKFCYSHTLRLFRRNPNPHSLLLPKLEGPLYREYNAYTVPFTSADDDDAEQSSVRTIPQLVLKNPFVGSAFRITQSCNGLLLCCESWSNGQLGPNDHCYRVCNLATGENVVLSLPRDKCHLHSFSPYIAFEPLRSPHYKVILFGGDGNGSDNSEPSPPIMADKTLKTTIEVGVYSSETNSWSEGTVFCSAPTDEILGETGVYCNGAIHWYTEGIDLVYFDVDRLCFNELSEPAFADYDDLCVEYFGESGGRLHLIPVKNVESLEFDIWELKEDYSGWIVRYHVDLNLMGEGDAILWHGIPPFYVLCVVPLANEEQSMLVLHADSKIMSYNLKDHTSRILIHDEDKPPFSLQHFDTLSCVGCGL